MKDLFTTYNWSNGSDLPYTEVKSSQIISAHKLLTLKVTDNNGCEFADSITIYLQAPSFANEYYNKTPISLFPNPNQGIFSIGYNSQFTKGILVVSIINAKGQICYTGEKSISGEENSIFLNLPELTKGTYLVKIKFNKKVYTEKMVVN